ncbi:MULTISPECIES: metal ABC transporter ATP-binding protein [Zhenhengia]|uniref:metal ABC transporter ATP-binding protein n=1 Tax=Zhenhengia TaxID=2944196 RepID=UPI001B7A0903|nr:metal ABC transporter ATP-binding protein [Zhenhengia yiwuensis]MBP3910834.1 metal ABC transporter ATP-binding protein [Niameybacter sp.]MBS5798947.1 metal ABC transporter ATP-binding protein [Clostridiales bacterium]MDU6359460.1 metal ABC transporter ATP-binding protein [Clostridiales bacterium]MDY3368171.1 metal ABC transporter ATP-binding protein [Zhenhengia yiwuensis]
MNECKFCCTELRDVTVCKEGMTLLDHINLHLHCNEITAIVGPNGAGKTTLFRTLLGEMHYTGEIKQHIHKNEKKTHGPIIGYVPQHLNFDRTTPLTTLDLFTACMQKRPIWAKMNTSFREEVLKALKEVKLDYAIDRKIGLLSGGELQRVLLALALQPKPDLLLLDEPISGVDVNGQKLFYETVHDLKSKYHMAIVLITHEIEALEHICDQAVLLNKKVLAIGKPEEVREEAVNQKQLYVGGRIR